MPQGGWRPAEAHVARRFIARPAAWDKFLAHILRGGSVKPAKPPLFINALGLLIDFRSRAPAELILTRDPLWQCPDLRLRSRCLPFSNPRRTCCADSPPAIAIVCAGRQDDVRRPPYGSIFELFLRRGLVTATSHHRGGRHFMFNKEPIDAFAELSMLNWLARSFSVRRIGK